MQAHFVIPADHPSKAGHFPGMPIVPGAVLLDHIVQHLVAVRGDGVQPSLLLSTKFLRPVRFGEDIELTWQARASGDLQFDCSQAGQRTLRGVLRFPDKAA